MTFGILLGLLIFIGFQFQMIFIPIVDASAKYIKLAWHWYEDNIKDQLH